MKDVIIRKAVKEDFPAILKLNEAVVEKTSPLNLERLTWLGNISIYHKVAVVDNQVAGFLLVMRSDADYPNDNFAYFGARFSSFLYIDRIVVGSDYFGLKIGTRLYQDLFAYAKEQNIENITCEYNLEPLNLASQAFHNKFGFTELGTQRVANGSKLVSLQVAKV